MQLGHILSKCPLSVLIGIKDNSGAKMIDYISVTYVHSIKLYVWKFDTGFNIKSNYVSKML